MAYYDEVQRKWIFSADPKKAEPLVPTDMTPFERQRYELERQQRQDSERQRQEFQSRSERPLLPSGPGQAVSEVGKAAANTGLAFWVTDPADLLTMGLDLVRGAASPITKDRLQGTFDDSDNPLTKWRRQSIKMETELGQAASNLLRIGFSLAFAPKVGVAGLSRLARIGKGADVAADVGKVASKAGQIASTAGKIATKIGDAFQSARPEAVTAALRTVQASELTSKAGKTLGRIAQNDSYLYATLRDFSRANRGAARINDVGKVEVLGETMKRWEGIKTAAGKYTSSKQAVKTFAQALAWDAFVAFNVAGEGDYSMDETFSDMLAGSNIPFLRALARPLTTWADDSSLEAKAKQMLEGLAFGSVIESALHIYRVSKYAKAWQNATGTERAAIISAFEGESQNIGMGLSKSMGNEDNLFTRGVRVEGYTGSPGPYNPSNAELKAQFRGTTGSEQEPPGALALLARGASEEYDALQEALRSMEARGVLQPGPAAAERGPSVASMPRTVGGPLAVREPVGTPQDAAAYDQWLRANANTESLSEPVQQALRSMLSRGVLQPGPAAAERGPSVASAPASRVAGGPLTVREFIGTPQDFGAYEEWLRTNAESLSEPVQQALRDMFSRGILQPGNFPAGQGPSTASAPGLPRGQLALPGGPPDFEPAMVREVPPDAAPALPPGSESYQQALQFNRSPITQGGIQQVNVRPLGEPIVTPQTYREGFAADAFRAAKEAWKYRDLVYEQGAGSYMQRVFDDVKALAPSNRLSALELLQNIGVVLNDAGIQNAADSVMTNFIQERGLKEGWIELDPETFAMTIRRDIAGELDRGDELVNQAEILDTMAAEREMLQGEAEPLVPGMEGVDMNPAFVDEVMASAARADQLDEQAQLEMVKAASLPQPKMTDEQAVLQAYGSPLNRLVIPAVIEKLPDRPGFGVYGQDGEPLKTFTSQRGAEAFVRQNLDAQKAKLIEQARAMTAQAQGVELQMQFGNPVLDSDIAGKVKITSAQARALDALLRPEARDLYSKLFPKLSELAQAAKSSRQIEMTQGQMTQMAERIREAAAAGAITPSQKTALNNLVERLQSSAELLAPEARAQRDVINLLDAMITLSKHGEFCGIS